MLFSIGIRASALRDGRQEEEIAGESTIDVVEHRVRPKGEVHEVRGVYWPGPQKELEGRQIRYRKCKVVARKGISEFYLWEVD